MLAWPRAAVVAVLVPACLADNPPLEGETETSGTQTESGTGPVVPENSLLGCAPGQTCRLLVVAQSYDDRIEIFAPDDPTQQYRGAIGFDLRPGTDNTNLDEPFGIALGPDFLHLIAGHYPMRDEGTMVSIPRTMLGEYAIGTTVPVEAIILGGAFQQPVVATPFGVPEPIFMLDRPVLGRFVIGTFNNDLFSTEDSWTQPGLLQVIDPADPTQFGTATLAGLDGGDCLGAAQVVTMEDETRVAVACDGNEAIAFLDLGQIGTAPPDTAAAAITGTVCELPPMNGLRVRYLAYDGVDGVVVGVGPGLTTQSASGQIYSVRRSNCGQSSVDLGLNGTAHPAQIARVGDAFLVASGTPVETTDAKRGIYVLTATGLCEEPLPGFESHWTTPGLTIEPYALAVHGTSLAVGAGVNAVRIGAGNDEYGKVLWAELSGVEDPCTMTASVVDLTDGAAGHAPSVDPVDPATVRRAPHVVTIAEVQG